MLQCQAGSFQEFAHAFYCRGAARETCQAYRNRGLRQLEQLAEAVLSDAVSPAICMNEGCNFTCEMEPDQDAGWCEECRTNSMHAALILAGLI